MPSSLSTLTIQVLLLAPTISALCSACTAYHAALASCTSNSANVTALGSQTNSATIHCMCSDKNSGSQMNQCLGCDLTDSSDDTMDEPNMTIMQAWVSTCTADTQFGDHQAVSCWEGQPGNPLPCYMKGAGAGSNTPGAQTNPSQSASSNTPLTTAAAKSDASASMQASWLLVLFCCLVMT